MRKNFFKLIIVFILIAVQLMVFSKLVKMPKYISELKNPTIENVKIEEMDLKPELTLNQI